MNEPKKTALVLIIILSIGLVSLAVEYLHEFKVFGRRWLALMVAGLVVLILLLTVHFARAHDNPENWIGIEHRQNARFELCCGQNDCRAYDADLVKVTADGYLFPDGELVPFKKAAPSIDGLYWKCVWGGETKCVFAPLGAS